MIKYIWMLINLNVRNFAIIEDLSVEFGQGLNVITGETGSGKSILITALGVTLGNKFSKEMLREGTDKILLSATFDISRNRRALSKLKEMGISDEVLFFQREIPKEGRQKFRINGMVVPYSLYREIGEILIDIHGQHEPQSLLNRAKHLELLDRFIGEEFLKEREEFARILSRYKNIKKEIEKIRSTQEEAQRRKDYLRFIIEEIENAGISESEEEELLEKSRILRNVSKLKEIYQNVFSLLQGKEGSAVESVSLSEKFLSEIQDVDKKTEEFLPILEEVESKLLDIVDSIKKRKEEIEFDPNELESIEERLSTYDELKRKYGKTTKDILDFLETSKRELSELDNRTYKLENLEKEKKELEDKLISIGKLLREKRKEVARILEKKIEKELSDLAMEKAKVYIKFLEKESEDGLPFNGKKLEPYNWGFEMIEFYIAPNPGESEKPLNRIASGGELSRIMLAIRTIFASEEEIPCIVFDEIDQGIGGRVGEMVGRKLLNLSKNLQTIVITHLPQIASLGEIHIVLSKNFSEGKTYLTARRIKDDERVYEIARMIGGLKVTDTAINHARELLKQREVEGV
ncbi:MAG: DNA repair protein RecN [Caldiserica bacterium]|nr:MAG: DNA repair protein RecN [Caldisericota bacterium]